MNNINKLLKLKDFLFQVRFLLFIFVFLVIIFCFFWFFLNRSNKDILINPQGTGIYQVTPTIITNKPLTTTSIFTYRKPGSDQLEQEKVTLLVTGDVIPARSVNATMVRKNNFLYPFEKTADFLKSGDLVFINLETPLLSDCPMTDTGMVFCGSDRSVEGLKYANVKVASLANNHAEDYGLVGVSKTVKLLEDSGISVTGTGEPAILPVKNKKFGFLGYNDIEKKEGITWADIEKIKKDIESLKPKVDFVVVTFHWGIEYTSKPTERQIELAHAAIDAGADLIIGNHPHSVQGVEVYKNNFITYAHGNFVFDQMWSQETREGVIGRYVFDETGLVDVSFYPVIIENYSQPRFAKESEALKILERMKEASIQF